MSSKTVLCETLAHVLNAPEGALIVLVIPMLFWQKGVVPDEMRALPWERVRGSIAVCFDGIDDDPREVYEFTEIRAFVRDALSTVPELVRKMIDERECQMFGKWSFIALANIEDPMDLTKFSDAPPERFARVFICDGHAQIEAVAVN